ncbi:MAG: peptide deformylase [Blastocatellia bacterium]|jgi:peptide deformylase|nr:peptide deformylase [Blastocatellia bacterium]MBK6428873.1 peptide deformylase [Blastocatellia bacterium]
MIREIRKYGDPVLAQTAEPVTEFDDKLKKLVNDMFETMYAAPGVGLAAPQVGISKRLFVMDCSTKEGVQERVALINPEIIVTEGRQLGDEGCLSFPGIYFQVERAQRVVARARNVKGEWFEIDTMDLPARCILHENDHLNGIVFINHLSALKRDLVKRKIRKRIKAGDW